MEQERDGEDGAQFHEWVEDNLKNDKPFDSYILVQDDRVLGTGSIVPDDHCVGKQLKMEGIWLGGVNVHRDYRRHGLGNILVDHIEGVLGNLARKEKKPRIVNLFSRNPVAVRMYEKRGFKRVEGAVVQHVGSENLVYSKTY